MKHKIILIVLILSLLSNAILLFYATGSDIKQELSRYPYISKRTLYEEKNDILINFLPLRNELRKTVEPFEDSFALYFEYLPTGTSIGINEKEEFASASLIKVPVVMSYFHYKERLGLKEDTIVTIQENQLDSAFGDLWKQGEGTEISLEEAARLALVESDNTAFFVLVANIPRQDFDDVYEGLDIEIKIYGDYTLITAKQYSSVLKALYFSSVLSKENSQRILEMLTQTKFNDKLPAGIPEGVPVAHKFGVLGDQLYQDCGIVYVPNRPYLLCMVSQSDEDDARERMKLVSTEIYEFVSQKKISGSNPISDKT